MPALSARSVVLGCSIPQSFAHHELNSNRKVRTLCNDFFGPLLDTSKMSTQRRGIPKSGANWFIKEWMLALNVKQSAFVKAEIWSKASASQIYTGKQDFSPSVVLEAASFLQVEVYELFMHPDDAMAIRKLRSLALDVVQSAPPPKEDQVINLVREREERGVA